MTPDEILQKLGEHMGKLKGVPLWILQMTPTESWPPQPEPGTLPDMGILERFVEHLDWLSAQEKSNVLVLSGTVNEEYGIGRGMAIIRAESREAAEAIAASEPFHQHGLRANTIQSWKVNEGSLNISIKLFNNEITFS